MFVIYLDWRFDGHLLANRLAPVFAEMTGHRGVPSWVTEDYSVLGFLNQVPPDLELGKCANWQNHVVISINVVTVKVGSVNGIFNFFVLSFQTT